MLYRYFPLRIKYMFWFTIIAPICSTIIVLGNYYNLLLFKILLLPGKIIFIPVLIGFQKVFLNLNMTVPSMTLNLLLILGNFVAYIIVGYFVGRFAEQKLYGVSGQKGDIIKSKEATKMRLAKAKSNPELELDSEIKEIITKQVREELQKQIRR